MTPEQTVALVAALIGIVVAVPAIAKTLASARDKDADARKKNAEAAFIEAQTRQKQAETDALREKAEIDTNQKVFGTITDTITEARNEKAQLKADLRVVTDQRDVAIIDLQNARVMIEGKNERITLLENEIRRLNITLENTQRRLEYCLDNGDVDLTDFNDLADTQRTEQ